MSPLERVQARAQEVELALREGRVAPDHGAAELLTVFRAGSRAGSRAG